MITFYSKAMSLTVRRPTWLGGRGSLWVCRGLPLLMVCIIFGLRFSSRVNANTNCGMDYSQQ